MMNDPQKSDGCTVAMKSANKPDGSGAESMERRRPAKGNAGESCHAPDTEPGERDPGT